MIAEKPTDVGATGNARKIALQMIGGALFGLLAIKALDDAVDLGLLFKMMSGPEIIAFTFSIMFALVALIVLGMSLSRTLFMTNHRHEDTSDAEYSDVKPMLRWSSISLLLYAGTMLLLAMAGQADADQKLMIFWGVVATMVAQTAIGFYLWRRYDELYRGVTRDSCAATFVVSEILLFVWGAATLCGLPIIFDPLAVIVAIAAVYWAASIWYISKRGMV
jgi:hypothetical protein